jgi:hypothetical protein
MLSEPKKPDRLNNNVSNLTLGVVTMSGTSPIAKFKGQKWEKRQADAQLGS